MSGPQITLFAILGGLFLLLIWGRWRYDVVAFAALMAAVIAGLVPADEAFSGFGHPATITVAAVLIISRGLAGSGATDFLARLIAPACGGTASHISALAGLGAALSSFMNNVGTLGLLMPLALQSAAKAARSPSILLMPLSFGCILGGLVTLIGTPPNIIVANIRGELTGEPFSMFDYTPVGLACALVGVLFVALIGWRLVPTRLKAAGAGDDGFDIEDYVAEVRVPKDCKFIDHSIHELIDELEDIDLQIVGLFRRGRRRPVTSGRVRLQSQDVLIVEAGPNDLDLFVSKYGLEFVGRGNARANLTADSDLELMEVVVSQGARIEGRQVASLRLPSRRGVNLLAVSRQGRPYRGRLSDFRFQVGDVLLLHGETERLNDAVPWLGCLPLAGRQIAIGLRRHAPWMIGIFAAAIAAASLGLLSIPVALGLAVTIMVASGMIPLRELYEGIEWPVIVLLGALIPVGGALQTTGATDLIAEGILWLTLGASPIVVLTLVLVVTMTLSDILNNAATAVVMAPIAASLADQLGVDSDPFLMAVAVGASCAFLTPIGHQNNALVMGPGGYHFGDYWRMGLPLEILVVLVSVPMILWVWPL